MSWLERKIHSMVVTRVVAKLVEYMDGKKTAVGAVSLLLWVAIYALPAFTPEYNWITVYATQLRDLLIASGVELDNSLFNVGVSFTAIGLADKIRKLFKKEKTNE